MSGILEKMKSNLGLTLDAIVAVVALCVIAWVVFFSVPGVRQEIKQTEGDIRQISQYRNASVVVPSVDPRKPDETLEGLTISQRINAQLHAMADDIDKQLVEIRDYTVRRNQQDHPWLVNKLFPTPATAALPHNAREQYHQSLARLFGKPGPNQVGLDAGMPPTDVAIAEAIEAVKAEKLASRLGPGFNDQAIGTLEKSEIEPIVQAMRNEQMQMLTQRAAGIHLYADSDPQSTDYPFSLVPISRVPVQKELWEAQMQLWIITDVCRAIAIANHSDDPTSSVLNNPVKRLLELTVLDGYVGIHEAGGVLIKTDSSSASASRSSTTGTTKIYDRPATATGMAGQNPDFNASNSENNENGEAGELAAINEKVRTSDNFYVSPTGRTSNQLYDVRHVRLRAVVDFKQLPQLLDALEQVNFMTVLSCDITNVDEYEALSQGYVYGSGDMVQVDLIIESLWLRLWTLEMMPDDVKISLGLIRTEGEKVDQSKMGAWGPGAGDSWENMPPPQP